MSERFDDMIRKQLEGLESPVPQDMFDAIRNQPDVSVAMFDASVKNKLQSAETPVTAGLFDKINAGADLTNSPFDETILQKITGYESPVPADMWNRIWQERQRRRPVAWWWIAAGLILLLSGGTWYAVQKQAGKQHFSTNNAPTEKNNAPATPAGISVTKKPEVPSIIDTLPDAVSIAQSPVTSTQNAIVKTRPPINDNVVNAKAHEKAVTDKFQQEQEFLTVKNSSHKKAGVDPAGKYNKTAGGTKLDTEIILSSSRDESAAKMENVTATLNSLRLSITQQLRNAAKLLPGQLLKARPRMPVIPCPVLSNEGRNDWYADIYTSAFMVQKQISDKAGGKNAKSGFDSTLHRQVSFNAGINLVKNIGNNILIKTGLQYNRTNESFRLTRINERKLITTISVRTVIIAPGDTVYIRDTSVTEHIGTIQRRNQNTYQQWDIPVIIGYEFGGENIHLNANAGIIANIRSTYTGQMLNDDTLRQVIDAKKYNGKPIYKTNVGISLYAGLSIIKPLSERTSLIIEPYARIGLQNITTDNAWFRQKNSAAGVSIGLRYQLNNSGQRR